MTYTEEVLALRNQLDAGEITYQQWSESYNAIFDSYYTDDDLDVIDD